MVFPPLYNSYRQLLIYARVVVSRRTLQFSSGTPFHKLRYTETYVHIYRIWASALQNQKKRQVCPANTDPPSLIRVFAVRMKKALALNYLLSAQWGLWSDWADSQADLSSLVAHAILLVLSWICLFHIIFSLIFFSPLYNRIHPKYSDREA